MEEENTMINPILNIILTVILFTAVSGIYAITTNDLILAEKDYTSPEISAESKKIENVSKEKNTNQELQRKNIFSNSSKHELANNSEAVTLSSQLLQYDLSLQLNIAYASTKHSLDQGERAPPSTNT